MTWTFTYIDLFQEQAFVEGKEGHQEENRRPLLEKG